MADIFISYKREDREWAEALSRALESKGWTTWRDTRLAAGESFDDIIEAELDRARCVIVLWSAASVKSRWVKSEAGEGLEREILVPVFIEEVRPPLEFRRIHTANFISWKRSSEEPMFVRLVADVSRILGPSPKEQEAEKASEEERKADQAAADSSQPQTGKLVLTSNKTGALRIDGRKRGAVKAGVARSIQKLLPGQHIIEIEALGSEPWRETVEIIAGRSAVLKVKLTPSPEVKTKTRARETKKPLLAAPSSPAFTNSIGIEFVLIQPGAFTMGSGRVTISKPYYLGKYAVMQQEWEAVMGNNPSDFKGNRRPVESVSWQDAQNYIKRLNDREGCKDCHRLPTEAEWEYACRAGTTTAYSFGDNERELADYAWYKENSGGGTHPVGEKKPNPWGLYDMHGNVWEWVADWYGALPKGERTDPVGPGSGSSRVIRGGGWDYGAGGARSAFRLGFAPVYRISLVGFRLVRTYP